MATPKPAFEEEPEFCFTSMIDIVFLLLIFFMLQPFKSPEMKLDNELPKDVGPSKNMEELRTIRLVVSHNPSDRNGAVYYINSTKLGPDYRRIAPALIKECKGDKSLPVSLNAEPTVHFMHVLRVLDQCHVAEMKKVSFEAPAPPSAGKKKKG